MQQRVARRDTGMVLATIREPFKSPKKIKSTSMARATACSTVLNTSVRLSTISSAESLTMSKFREG